MSMKLELEVKRYTLKFAFNARTSRGSMSERRVWYLKVTDGLRTGIGEVAPIKGLSPESIDDIPDILDAVGSQLRGEDRPEEVNDCLELSYRLVGNSFPSVRFGLETALLDLIKGGKKQLFDAEVNIPINGLVWMDTKEEMIRQVDEKLHQGFSCIKSRLLYFP